ncbi:hypothetical protein [Brevibacillus daliensis]|uniref:hypothetical protein n=1 Tax=Brevibacillus daliensis TaxID=2892995 RepID=UPI001E4FB37B|nr:hypothetical protein [Brevibacillus daliensis]
MKKVKSLIVTALVVTILSVAPAAYADTDIKVTPSVPIETLNDGNESLVDDYVIVDAILPRTSYIKGEFSVPGDETFTFDFDRWEKGEDELTISVTNLGKRDLSTKVWYPSGNKFLDTSLKPGKELQYTLKKNDFKTEFGEYVIKLRDKNGDQGRAKISVRAY